ncbi:unnamed protein product [Bemisia tabaci]|uniref:Uncharacterized protein n=1 Tax=Bemisia tabaci TaxID=7038 RepID=A0A9P0AGE7_BEMTA|nr:unnamed protein product [Bemisia tabaci]
MGDRHSSFLALPSEREFLNLLLIFQVVNGFIAPPVEEEPLNEDTQLPLRPLVDDENVNLELFNIFDWLKPSSSKPDLTEVCKEPKTTLEVAERLLEKHLNLTLGLKEENTRLKIQINQTMSFLWACKVRTIIEELEQTHGPSVRLSNEDAKGISPRERSRRIHEKMWKVILKEKKEEFEIKDLLSANERTKAFKTVEDLAKGISYAWAYLSDTIHRFRIWAPLMPLKDERVALDSDANKAIQLLTFNKEL